VQPPPLVPSPPQAPCVFFRLSLFNPSRRYLDVVVNIFGANIYLGELDGLTDFYDESVCATFGCQEASVTNAAPADFDFILSTIDIDTDEELILWRGTGPTNETVCYQASPPPPGFPFGFIETPAPPSPPPPVTPPPPAAPPPGTICECCPGTDRCCCTPRWKPRMTSCCLPDVCQAPVCPYEAPPGPTS